MTVCPQHISDSEVDANRRLIAAAILIHPFAILLDLTTVRRLVAVLDEDLPADPAPERRLLRAALAAIDALEIAASVGVAA
jgi:hypothetical protein